MHTAQDLPRRWNMHTAQDLPGSWNMHTAQDLPRSWNMHNIPHSTAHNCHGAETCIPYRTAQTLPWSWNMHTIPHSTSLPGSWNMHTISHSTALKFCQGAGTCIPYRTPQYLQVIYMVGWFGYSLNKLFVWLIYLNDDLKCVRALMAKVRMQKLNRPPPPWEPRAIKVPSGYAWRRNRALHNMLCLICKALLQAKHGM